MFLCFFQDVYSNVYMKFDESNMVLTDERETDKDGNLITKRVDNDREKWIKHGEYLVSEFFDF